MSFTVQNVYTAMTNYFAGRNIPSAQCYENIRKAVLELSEDYPFPGLQVTGPTVALTIGNPGPYLIGTFQNPGGNYYGQEINKFDSLFIYYNGPPTPGAAVNAGFPLKWKSIKDIEILMNIQGLPTNWTRYDDQIYVAMAPDQIYYVYLRQQYEHPFPNAGTPLAGNDQILLPNSWQDIVELATAEREASDFNLDAQSQKFHNRLYGDPKFQATGGTEGAPGLIFARTSQAQRDSTTTTKSMRLMIRPVMR
jgi:hypothetical protein